MTIGTVGTNFIVDTFIEAARKAGAGVSASYSRNARTGADFAKKHGIGRVYSEQDEFLADTSLDFIYVAAPNSLHYRWCLDALNAEKNVICEKPFVSNAKEARVLVSLAKKKNLFLFEALTVPHLPNFRLIQEKLPALGDIRFVQLNFSQHSSRYGAFREGKNPNLFNPGFSGGALMDINYYNLSFITLLFGSPLDIRYTATKAENGIDVSGILVLRYDGFIASAIGAKDSDSRNYVQIQGEKGYIYSQSTASNLRGGIELCTKNGEAQYNRQEENALYYELLDFIADYKAGDASSCDASLAESIKRAQLMDRARSDAGIVFPADLV
ncbi:MAG: Gfo/Idh/MocA family oxidoreductase [Treponema sp.]|jgi:predicted dehydrogenase|nr:Gfo/Idh/MocA family oxidoreductase [Treponema sp.]